MKKNKKTALFIVIYLNTIIIFIIANLIIYALSSDKIPARVSVNGINLGKLTIEEANEKIESGINNNIQKYTIDLQYEDEGIYEINYTSINAKVDTKSTIEDILGGNRTQKFVNYMRGMFGFRERKVNPHVEFDVSKLRNFLYDISKEIEVMPLDADIWIEGDEIVKKPEIIGRILDVENTILKIKDALSQNWKDVILLSEKNNFEIIKVYPDFEYKYIESVDRVLSKKTVNLSSSELALPARVISESLNKVIVFSPNIGNENLGGEFKLSQYLNYEKINTKGIYFENTYYKFANAIYTALVEIGIKEIYITDENGREKHIENYTYKDGKIIDVNFRNVLDNNIVIFAGVVDSELYVYVAG